jgi:hypothetical protein
MRSRFSSGVSYCVFLFLPPSRPLEKLAHFLFKEAQEMIDKYGLKVKRRMPQKVRKAV